MVQVIYKYQAPQYTALGAKYDLFFNIQIWKKFWSLNIQICCFVFMTALLIG